MRIVPLLRSDADPTPWSALPAAELAWTGGLHPAWNRLRPAPPEVHALHLPAQPWGPALGEAALAALKPRLSIDFLVLRAGGVADRSGTAAFLGVLEGLLEVASGEGFKIALRPAPGAAPELAGTLRTARGAAVGYCWDASVGADLDAIADRLFCAVGGPGDDFGPIQRLGYRWNLAVPAADPDRFETARTAIAARFPPVLFPDLPEAGSGPAPEAAP
jgi:hypothetical protein